MSPSDPRPQLRSALDQTHAQLLAITPQDLRRPTPCSEFDVATLLAHLVAVLRKIAAVGRGEDMSTLPDPALDLTDDVDGAFREARDALEHAWASDSALDQDYTLPWGPMSGREVLDAYTHEFVVHNWDLAQATGRDGDLDPSLAAAALDWYVRNVPAGSRDEKSPFGPAVTVPADADAYTRLAGFVGRRVEE